jgi:hypothetical protein
MARPADTSSEPLNARATTHAIVERRGGGGGRLERIFRRLAGAELTGELIDSSLIIGLVLGLALVLGASSYR